jgi:hypothetical protein
MTRVTNPAVRSHRCIFCAFAAFVFVVFVLASACLFAQDQQQSQPTQPPSQPAQQSQPAPSLADTARQLRAQKHQDSTDTDSSRAQDLANEFEEEQDDAGNAPAGFKIYHADNYKLRVPAPFTLGHDDAGTVLNSTLAQGSRSLLLLGNGVFFAGSNSDDAFQDYSEHYTRVYSPSTSCTKTSIGGHEAYQCGLSNAKLSGQVVSGNAVFVRGSRNIFPVFCAAPSDSWARDIYNKQHMSRRTKTMIADMMDKDDEKVRDTWQTCDLVLQSIHLKEDDRLPPNRMTTRAKATSPR